MTHYRQGDVLLVKVRSLPAGATKAAKDERGRIVLANGEVTGHAHVIVAELAEPYVLDGTLYIKADGAIELRHEEHGTVTLARGVYKRVIQREYSPEAIRNVAD